MTSEPTSELESMNGGDILEKGSKSLAFRRQGKTVEYIAQQLNLTPNLVPMLEDYHATSGNNPDTGYYDLFPAGEDLRELAKYLHALKVRKNYNDDEIRKYTRISAHIIRLVKGIINPDGIILHPNDLGRQVIDSLQMPPPLLENK